MIQEWRSKEVSLQGRKKSTKKRIPGWQVGYNLGLIMICSIMVEIMTVQGQEVSKPPKEVST